LEPRVSRLTCENTPDGWWPPPAQIDRCYPLVTVIRLSLVHAKGTNRERLNRVTGWPLLAAYHLAIGHGAGMAS
jgi:hypothetical protein